jgi:Carboxypeptidase regulatory-like domain
MALPFKPGLSVFAFVTLGWTSCCLGGSPRQTVVPGPETHSPRGMSGEQLPDQASGRITGTIVDPSGAVVAGARVRLNGEDRPLNQEVLSGKDGQFSFSGVAPGAFQLAITSATFATRTFAGVLHPGEVDSVVIALDVAEVVTEVRVGPSQTEVAEEQMKVEEKQRLLGVFPNFYVSYVSNAAALNSKQKFRLAWKTVSDPSTFLFTGAVAGFEQATNRFAGYGQGAQGYGKRFGAAYADTVSGTFISGAILPSLLKQDPRYYYKGIGSKRSRILYALANSVICKGDNRRWQPNYSTILGSLAVGGISNLYYAPQDRNGAKLTFENAGLAIGATAISSLFQEFLLRKLTPNVTNAAPAKP